MYEYIHIYIYTCMYIYIHVCTYTHLHAYSYVYTFIHTHKYIHTHIYIYIFIYIYLFILYTYTYSPLGHDAGCMVFYGVNRMMSQSVKNAATTHEVVSLRALEYFTYLLWAFFPIIHISYRMGFIDYFQV